MKNQAQILEENKGLIVAFHIGRGGRFNNQGHLSYLGEREIGEFTDDLFCGFEDQDKLIDGNSYYKSNEDDIINLINDEKFEELENVFNIEIAELGEKIYRNSMGADTGLTQDDVDSGIGCIDIDGDYDTTYTTTVGELSESEINAILNRGFGFFGSFAEELTEANEVEENENEG